MTKSADLSHRGDATIGHDDSIPDMKGVRAGKK
jgi:hypothetical protein